VKKNVFAEFVLQTVPLPVQEARSSLEHHFTFGSVLVLRAAVMYVDGVHVVWNDAYAAKHEGGPETVQ